MKERRHNQKLACQSGHVKVVGVEKGEESAPKEKEQAGEGHKKHRQAKKTGRCLSGCCVVALPQKLPDANGGGGPEPCSGHVANGRKAYGHLVRSQSGSAVGSDDPGRQGKGRNLKNILQARRHAELEQGPNPIHRQACGRPNFEVDESAMKEKKVHRHSHVNAGD